MHLSICSEVYQTTTYNNQLSRKNGKIPLEYWNWYQALHANEFSSSGTSEYNKRLLVRLL